jgi:hypothetical protein
MRWFWLLATVSSFVACFTRHTPGPLAFWFFAGIFGAIATVLAFAQARIDERTQADPLMDCRLRQYDKTDPPQP